MTKSSRPDRKEPRERTGRFIQGEYSPTHRLAVPATTSVPPRASAHPADVVKVRPRYTRLYTGVETLERDLTRIPTMPPPTAIWQYETPRYEAESSLSSLSLAISEATRIRHSPAIDELDTMPPAQDTAALPLVARKGGGQRRGSFSDQEGIDRTKIKTTPAFVEPQEVPTVLHPFDRFRWWLLVPGRIELIAWICGTLLLICITGLLMFMLAASMGFFRPGSQQISTSSLCSLQGETAHSGVGGESCTISTASSTSGLRVAMIGGDFMQVGKELHLQGQGFHRSGHIILTHDTGLPCQPGIVQADEHGEFAVVIKLDDKRYWSAGRHQIKIEDVESKDSITLDIMLQPQK